jgi:hypothetical protein
MDFNAFHVADIFLTKDDSHKQEIMICLAHTVYNSYLELSTCLLHVQRNFYLQTINFIKSDIRSKVLHQVGTGRSKTHTTVCSGTDKQILSELLTV